MAGVYRNQDLIGAHDTGLNWLNIFCTFMCMCAIVLTAFNTQKWMWPPEAPPVEVVEVPVAPELPREVIGDFPSATSTLYSRMPGGHSLEVRTEDIENGWLREGPWASNQSATLFRSQDVMWKVALASIQNKEPCVGPVHFGVAIPVLAFLFPKVEESFTLLSRSPTVHEHIYCNDAECNQWAFTTYEARPHTGASVPAEASEFLHSDSLVFMINPECTPITQEILEYKEKMELCGMVPVKMTSAKAMECHGFLMRPSGSIGKQEGGIENSGGEGSGLFRNGDTPGKGRVAIDPTLGSADASSSAPGSAKDVPIRSPKTFHVILEQEYAACVQLWQDLSLRRDVCASASSEQDPLAGTETPKRKPGW